MRLQVTAVDGVPEVTSGDDLPAVLAVALRAGPGLREGDVLVVSSKVVAKAEGRARAAASRDQAITDETVRVVAARGAMRVVETHHGLIIAAAGVDASNVEAGTVLLLPVDPDTSARALRSSLLAAFGLARLGVVVSDTAGRAWRQGQVDIAIGCAGLDPLLDLRGTPDAGGRTLDATVVALADELASAADVVRPKAAGVPAAVIRGTDGPLPGLRADDGPGAAALIRPAHEDLFRLGTREAMVEGALAAVAGGRTTVALSDKPVDPASVARAIALAEPLLPEHGSLVVLAGEPGPALVVASLGEGEPGAQLVALGAAVQAVVTALRGLGLASGWRAADAEDVAGRGDAGPAARLIPYAVIEAGHPL